VGEARGFTLVETLVVIAIIVLLAAMLFPVYETVTKRAERAVCLTNIRNIGLATRIYADDYDGRCVPARISTSYSGFYGTCWELLLQPYLRSELILLCPSDSMPQPTAGSISVKHSYGINYDIALIGGYNGNSALLSEVDYPAETILFFELRGASRSMGTSFDAHGLSRVDARHGEGANFLFVGGNAKWEPPVSTATPRGGRANMWQP